MPHILHITTRAAWVEAQQLGAYRTPSLDTDGFIHLCSPHQVSAAANARHRCRRDLVLLCVSPEKLTARLNYEAFGTPKPYPHLYGPLNLDAVVRIVDVPPNEDGRFQLPATSAF
jgi:uncharacterized protein (DUF952 family)